MNAPAEQRLHALDAVRGFALLLGVAFHAALSFMPGWPPGIWAMNDSSPSAALSDAAFVSHLFRMTLFFFIAGFFARLLHQKLGTAGFWKNRLMRIGVPQNVEGLKDVTRSPAYATAAGLLLYGRQNQPQAAVAGPGLSHWLQRTGQRVGDWFKGSF